MITDLLNSIIFVSFVFYGLRKPQVALAGVIWIDLYKPQLLSYSFLLEKPLSLLMVGYFLVVMVLNFDKFRRPSKISYVFIVLAFMVWITITTIYSEFPFAAWPKHDIAFKTILFSFFIPFVLRRRDEIELFVWVVIASLGCYMFLAGIKAMLGGGGYGVNLINNHPGMTWNEGSTLATQAISLMPFLYYASKYSLIVERHPQLKKILAVFAFSCLMVLVGTQARTGLVALFMLVLMAIYYSKSKVKMVLSAALVPLLILPFLPSAWFERMSTISDTKQESSAHGRVVVWRWTIDYVSDRPFMGGGFQAYLANDGKLADYSKDGEVEIEHPGGKAFHNIFIEVLGEHGYVGLALFLSIIGQALLTARKIYNFSGSDDWQRAMATTVFVSLSVYCVGGMFIGVAFFPWIYYMLGVAIALNNSMQLGRDNQDARKKRINKSNGKVKVVV